MGDVCGADVQKLYVEDAGSKQEPVGFALCSEKSAMCKDGCSCRKTSKAKVNGSTKYLNVCVNVPNGKDCVTSGEDHVSCAVGGTSSGLTTPTPKKMPDEPKKDVSNDSNKNVPKPSTTNESNDSNKNEPNNITKGQPNTSTKDQPNTSTKDQPNDSTQSSTQNIAQNSLKDSTKDITQNSLQNVATDSTQSITPTTNKAVAESTNEPASSTSSSGSVPLDANKVSNTSMSSSSMNSTVMIVIIIIAVVFVALVSWVIRSYCLRRSKAKSKTSARRNRSIHNTNFQAASPSNLTGRSSNTPSFPAFDRRPREIQTPATGERAWGNQGPQRGRTTPGYEPNSGRSRETNSGRGRRNPAMDFAPNRAHPMDREPISRYNERNPYMDGPRREPGSGRGRKMPNIDAQFAPNGPRGFNDASMQYETNSGRGRRDNYGMYNDESAMRNPSWEPRTKQVASPKPPNNTAASSGGTVYTGRNTFDRVAQFAQLAAFEAPASPPPRPQRPIQSVAVSDAVPKRVRAPAQNTRPAPPAPSVSKHSGFYIDESPAATEYDILSPKTARSLAPSIASSAATVVAGRNRPTPLQQRRRQQHSSAIDSYYESTYSNDENKRGGESRYDKSGSGNNKFKASGNYDESFMSEASSMAWSSASGLSDNSYYNAPPSNRARIPVIEAPRDDDDDQSEDAYSDWGQSTQQSADDFRSTAASFSAADASFFSVKSDYTDSDSSMFKEREF